MYVLHVPDILLTFISEEETLIYFILLHNLHLYLCYIVCCCCCCCCYKMASKYVHRNSIYFHFIPVITNIVILKAV